MTKFLKAVSISGAVAIALSLGTASILGTNIEVSANGEAAQKVIKVSPVMAIENKLYAEAYDEAFEAALQEEASKIDYETYSEGLAAAFEEYVATGDHEALHNDPYYKSDPRAEARARAEQRAREECEKKGLSSAIELVKDNDKTWEGYFSVDSIKYTSLYFSSPSRFSCSVGGRTATIMAKSGYTGNYKTAEVILTYSNGKTASSSSQSSGSTCSVTVAPEGTTITSATYYLTIYDGTTANSRIIERAVISLTRN